MVTFKSKQLAKVWVGVLLMLTILLTSCGMNKYSIALGLADSDSAFMTGTLHGYNVYIWTCHQNKHIVVYQEFAEMWSYEYKREESLCGSQTAIEIQLADDKSKKAIDPKEFWR